MSPEHLAQYERLKKKLQAAILRDYPNPKREGCPDRSVLLDLAQRPFTSTIEDDDPHWKHITHCSECYQEFLKINNDFRQRVKRRRSLLVGVLVSLIACFLALHFWRRNTGPEPHQNAQLEYAKQNIVLPALTRSVDSADKEPLVLQRGPNELNFRLPNGSAAGVYEVEFRKQGVPVFSSNENAELQEGVAGFTVRVDLSKFSPGPYSIVVRQSPFDWRYPAVIR